MKINNICPACGVGHLSPQIDYDVVAYKDQTKSLPARFSVCDTCGSETATQVDLRENKRIFIEFKKCVDGLLTGSEIRAIKTDVWKITPQQACLIFGGGPKAFSKYESDDVIQSEAMDKLIRLASLVPEAFIKLREMTGEVKIETSVAVSKTLPIWHSETASQFNSDELCFDNDNSYNYNHIRRSIKIRTVAKKVA